MSGLTQKQQELLVGLKEIVEKSLVQQLQENSGNKITSSVSTGIYSIVSTNMEQYIKSKQEEQMKNV